MSSQENLWGENSPLRSLSLVSIPVVVFSVTWNIMGIALTGNAYFFYGLAVSGLFATVMVLLPELKPAWPVFSIKLLLLSFMGLIAICFLFGLQDAGEDLHLEQEPHMKDRIDKITLLLDGPCEDFKQHIIKNPEEYLLSLYIERCL